MRALALLLVALPALVLAQAQENKPATPPPAPKKPTTSQQVYKWVDEKGVVHYTDKPPAEGARPAQLPPLQTFKGGTKPNLSKFDKPGSAATGNAAGGETFQIDVVTPSRDETFRSGERVVPVAVVVTPQLQAGQKLIYLLDGTPASTPTADTSYALTEVERGTHTVSVALVDSSGNQIATSNGVTFHVKPPTVEQGNRARDNTLPPKPTPPPAKPPKPKP